MKKLLFNLIIFTIAVIGWVVYSHWGQITAAGERVVSVGEDLAKMAKQSGVLPPDVIEAGTDTGIGSGASSDTPAIEPSTVVYKWRDASGRWNFGDDPPPGATDLQPMNVSANINVVSAVEVPEQKPETKAPSGPFMGIVSNGGSGGSGSNTTIPGIPNPANIQDMMNQIGDIQNSYNNRSKAID